jgi:hypothetical protein
LLKPPLPCCPALPCCIPTLLRSAPQKAAILARVAEVVAELPPEDLPDDVREWANAMMHDEWEDDPAAVSTAPPSACLGCRLGGLLGRLLGCL